MIKKNGHGLIGTHIATGMGVEINLTKQEMLLACAKVEINESWEKAMDMVKARLGIEVIGQIEIEQIVINGVAKTFH
jgi:hypothetical protein